MPLKKAKCKKCDKIDFVNGDGICFPCFRETKDYHFQSENKIASPSSGMDYGSDDDEKENEDENEGDYDYQQSEREEEDK